MGVEDMEQLTHGTACSTRDAVKLIVPGTGDACGNSTLPRARGDVVEHIRSGVLAAVSLAQSERGNWPAFGDVEVAVRENIGNRGLYHITVYGTRKG